ATRPSVLRPRDVEKEDALRMWAAASLASLLLLAACGGSDTSTLVPAPTATPTGASTAPSETASPAATVIGGGSSPTRAPTEPGIASPTRTTAPPSATATASQPSGP